MALNFSFNLKIIQEMLNIEKLENMHDQEEKNKNTCNLTTSHNCKHFGVNSSRPFAMYKNLFLKWDHTRPIVS